MNDTDLAYEAGREDGIAEATKAIAEAMKLLRRDALDEDTDRDWRWGVKHSIWVIERSLQEQAAAAPAPYDRCPFCGTPGRIVGSDEGTQYFAATPAPQAEGLDAEAIARTFHEAYERLAPSFGYETRKASAVPWESVPEPNRSLMVAVAGVVAAAYTYADQSSAGRGEG